MEEPLTIELDFCLSKTKLEAIDKMLSEKNSYIPLYITFLRFLNRSDFGQYFDNASFESLLWMGITLVVFSTE